MFIVDNRNKLSDLLDFTDSHSFYRFVCLLRKKDFDGYENSIPPLNTFGGGEIFIKQWLVDSQDKLDKLMPEMEYYTQVFKARLYVSTDKKSVRKSLMSIRDDVLKALDQFMTSNPCVSTRALSRLVNSGTALDSSSLHDSKMYLFDVDTKAKEVVEFLEKQLGENHVSTWNSKNGYHVLARKKFNDEAFMNNCLNVARRDKAPWFLDELKDNVEVKENALALVLMEG